MLRHLAGVVLLLALVFAPWALACVDDWAKVVLGALGVAGGLLWIAHHIRMRTRPRIPLLALLLVVVLLLLGWAMTLNAHSLFDGREQRFLPAAPPLPAFPGAVDRFSAIETLWPLTGSLLLLLVAADLATTAAWRWRILITIILTTASVSAYGIVRKLGLLPPLTFHPGHPESVFGPFDYHGNAGSFLNLAIPLAFAAALEAWRRRRRAVAGASLAAAILMIAGNLVNISRAAQLVLALELFAMAIWCALALKPRVARIVAPLGGALVTAAAIFVLSTNARGSLLAYVQAGSHSGRALAAKVAWGMSTDSPWFGSGPGSFKLLFPHSPHWIFELYSHWIVTSHIPGKRVSEWSYACNDLLQGAVEWGWPAMGVWVALGVGPFLRRGYLRELRKPVWAGVALGVGGLFLHALGDYPLQIASLQLYAAVLVGVAWGLPPTAQLSQLEERSRTSGAADNTGTREAPAR